MNVPRCPWASTPAEIAYHDQEWGRPLHDDRALFELLVLEGMQAGVSWRIILDKREAFRQAFDRFQPEIVASYGPEKLEELMRNPGILRNRSKLRCAVSNAQAFLRVQEEFGSFDAYLWGWVDGVPIVNHPQSMKELSAQTPLSQALSADLTRRGFKYVGPVIVYAYLQSAGLVNDHMAWCPWHGGPPSSGGPGLPVPFRSG